MVRLVRTKSVRELSLNFCEKVKVKIRLRLRLRFKVYGLRFAV